MRQMVDVCLSEDQKQKAGADGVMLYTEGSEAASTGLRSLSKLLVPQGPKKANHAAAGPCGKRYRLLWSCNVQVSLGIQDPDGLLFGLEAPGCQR